MFVTVMDNDGVDEAFSHVKQEQPAKNQVLNLLVSHSLIDGQDLFVAMVMAMAEPSDKVSPQGRVAHPQHGQGDIQDWLVIRMKTATAIQLILSIKLTRIFK